MVCCDGRGDVASSGKMSELSDVLMELFRTVASAHGQSLLYSVPTCSIVPVLRLQRLTSI